MPVRNGCLRLGHIKLREDIVQTIRNERRPEIGARPEIKDTRGHDSRRCRTSGCPWADNRPVASSFCQPCGVSPLDPVNQTAAQTTDRWNVLRQQQHSQRQHPEANNRQKSQEAAAEKQQGDRYPHPSGRWLAQPSDPARKRRWQLVDERSNTRIIKHLLSMTLNRRSGEFARLLNELRFHGDRAQAFFGWAFEWRLQRLLLRPGGQARTD